MVCLSYLVDITLSLACLNHFLALCVCVSVSVCVRGGLGEGLGGEMCSALMV